MKTRYKGLTLKRVEFTHPKAVLWRFHVHNEDTGEDDATGPYYRSKDEAFADISLVVGNWGLEAA